MPPNNIIHRKATIPTKGGRATENKSGKRKKAANERMATAKRT
jgi:hypothetical protein